MIKYLFRVYQWLIAAPILLVLTIVIAIITIIGGLIDKDILGYYPPVLWSKCFCLLLMVRVVVKGRENINSRTPYIFVANHQGAFDIFSIYGFLNHRFSWMMRKGLRNFPLIGWACEIAGHIMVDHSSQSSIKKTMTDAERSLSKGKSLVIFPEGRRTDTGEMGNFKSGAFRLAAEFRRPVVPITIDGSFRVMPRSTFNVTPGTITLTIHKPIEVPESIDIKQLSEQCFLTIKSALPE